MVSHKTSDKRPPVVLDIGSAFTKAGYAGDDKPICIVESKLEEVGDERWLKDIHSPQELRCALRKFLRRIYLRRLLVSMGERSVIVCEQLLCAHLWKNTVAQVLLVDFEVPAVVFAPRQLLSLYTLGINTGLVVHSGYSETMVLPIYESTVLLNCCQTMAAGGQAIEENLRRQISETAKIETEGDLRSLQDSQEMISQAQIEDIKVRTCFITRMDRAENLRFDTQSDVDGVASVIPSDVCYPLRGDTMLHIPGMVRETACEIMYDQENREQNLANIVLDSIMQCPVDCRRRLAANIVLIGGSTMIPGYKHRLQQELIQLSKQPQYSDRMSIETFAFHNTSKENYIAWLGGAIFGACARLAQYSVTRDEFEALNLTVPDWSTYTPSISQQYDSPV